MNILLKDILGMFYQLDLPTLQEYMGHCSINIKIKGNQLLLWSHCDLLGPACFVLQKAILKFHEFCEAVVKKQSL